MQKKDRILGIDLLKSFIIIFPMIGIHCMYDLTTLNAEDGFLEGFINVISTQFGAPMFMFCMGLTFRYSRHQGLKDCLYRGIKLITFGMVLNVLRYLPTAYSAAKAGEENIFSGWALIFNVDILQFAGLAIIALGLLRRLNVHHMVMLATAVALNVAGTLLDGCYTGSYAVNQLLGYFYPTPSCCCFPFMNWFIFVAAGNAMGYIFQKHDVGRFLRVAAPVGTVITAVYLYLCLVAEAPFTRALQSDWGYYSMHTPDALFTSFGIAPFMLGLFHLLSLCIPRKWVDFLCYPSRKINMFFCVSWVWIMWTANLLLFIPKATTSAGFLLSWFVIVLLTTVTVKIYTRYLQAGVNAFFSRNSNAWIIGIWAVLIAFGFWYFSTVPGPYTMPY